jgi:hypothetical protein
MNTTDTPEHTSAMSGNVALHQALLTTELVQQPALLAQSFPCRLNTTLG